MSERQSTAIGRANLLRRMFENWNTDWCGDWNTDRCGATGSTGASSEELTSASNVMKKLVQKKIVNANLAARNSNDMLLIRRAEMHAFKMAVRYLQAARHRDAVFVRAIKTGTHVMGFSRIVDQVKGMKRTARAARNAFVTTLETVYTVPSEVQKYLKKLENKQENVDLELQVVK